MCSDRKDSLHRRELKWFGSQGRKEIYCSFNYIHALYIPNYMNIKFRRFHVIRGSTRTVRVCNTGKPYLKPPLPPPLPPAMQKWKRKKERKERNCTCVGFKLIKPSLTISHRKHFTYGVFYTRVHLSQNDKDWSFTFLYEEMKGQERGLDSEECLLFLQSTWVHFPAPTRKAADNQ